MVTKYYVFYLSYEYLDLIRSENGKPDMPVSLLKHEEYDGSPCSYRLYAVTSSKRYASIFRKTRNMDYFIEREIYVSEEEIYDFESMVSSHIIGKHRFRTVLEIEGEEVLGDLVFPVPEFESDTIALWGQIDVFTDLEENDERNGGFLSDLALFDPELTIFREDIREMLMDIGFDYLVSMTFPTEEYPWLDAGVSINELMQYVHVYHNLYKKDGLIKMRKKYSTFVKVRKLNGDE